MMENLNKSSKLSQNLYFNSLIRIMATASDSARDFLSNILKEIQGLTDSEAISVFEIDEDAYQFKLTLSSGTKEGGSKGLPEYLNLMIKTNAVQRSPLLINESDILGRPDSSNDQGDCLICFIAGTGRSNSEAVFVLFKRSHDFNTPEAENIQIFLNLLWKISSVYRLAEQAESLKEKAENEKYLKNNFIIDLSHKIRTPVNAILGFSNLLLESEENAEINKKYLSIILDSSTELLSISENFSELSKLEYNLQRTSLYRVNIKDVLMEFEDFFSAKARERNLRLSVRIDLTEQDTIINTDGNKLNQIIRSLMDCAFKFTVKGGIELGCRKIPGFIEFRVVDSGIGFPDNLQEDISNYFSPDENVMKYKTNETITGLAIAYAYVKHLNGNIWFRSKEGVGGAFYFTLPFIPVPPEKKISTDVSSSGVTGRKKGKVILVAEDDDNNYTLIERIILNENYGILRAGNGQEAVDLCKSKDIDLVLMDIQMPVMDGYEATKEILNYKPYMKIIAQTAYQDDRSTVIENGCVDFIAKPFNRLQLTLLLKHYLK